MRALVQRVTEARVRVICDDGPSELAGEIGAGLCVLVGVPVETGRFRTDMQVGLVNDGPVTVLVEVPSSLRHACNSPPVPCR